MIAHLIVNTHRPDAVEASKKAVAWGHGHGFSFAADLDTAALVGVDGIRRDEFGNCDAVLAFGGDGTLLRAAHWIGARQTPILGIYYGRFGFVTQCQSDQVEASMAAILAGELEIEERMMLCCKLVRGGSQVAELHGLNEVVVQRAANARMMTFEVAIDGHVVANYPADGVIVATPTGSTAYNLSAGGPVLDPMMEAFVLSALAPHTLTARPLVIRADSEIRLGLDSDHDSVLSVDGQSRLHLMSDDAILITRSDRVTRLYLVNPADFHEKLAQRMFFSQSMYGEGN